MPKGGSRSPWAPYNEVRLPRPTRAGPMDQIRRSPDRDVDYDDFDFNDPSQESKQADLRGPSPGKLAQGSRLKVMRKATGLASTPAASRYAEAAPPSRGSAPSAPPRTEL
mgnify:FL=1